MSEGEQGEADDWEWRRRIRANPHSRRLYRIAVGALGLVIVLGGLALVPLPGPGWVIVFVGVGVWASEFEWARRLRHWGHGVLRAWTDWMRTQPWWVNVLVGLATLVVVLALFYLLFLISGVPGLIPDFIENHLRRVPGLAG